MQYIIEKKGDNTTILPSKIVEPRHAKAALSPLAWKILKMLANTPSYPKELGKKLKMHEQKVYYHIRNLEKAGLIKVLREEAMQGATAKYYTITQPSISLVLKPLEPATKLFSIKQKYRDYLSPFIEDGKFNGLIVIGNPEPHGPTKEKGHDGLYATDLALFLGTFLNYIPASSIKLDTEMTKEDLKKNLIIIGGPGVNSIMKRVNEKLPVRFQEVKYKDNYFTSFYSTISKKTYSEGSYGIIVKAPNPWKKSSSILVIAGRKFYSTKAAVLAFLENFEEIVKGNSYNPKVHARIIDGIDRDSDGVVDYVEFLE